MKYFLSALAIFKNEEMVIKEWIDHYRWQGIEHIYLIDNGSDDNTLEVLKPYIDENYVSLYDLPEKYKHVQHYNTVYNLMKHETKWLLICDIDEYMYGVNEPLLNYVEKTDNTNINCIKSNWLVFGSSGYDKQPESIRISFISRNNHFVHFKCIIKTDCVKMLGIHNQTFINKNMIDIVDNENIRLNHYQIMSKEYFGKVKMTRGSSDGFPGGGEVADKKRTWDYFFRKDFAYVNDYILSDLVKNGYKL